MFFRIRIYKVIILKGRNVEHIPTEYRHIADARKRAVKEIGKSASVAKIRVYRSFSSDIHSPISLEPDYETIEGISFDDGTYNLVQYKGQFYNQTRNYRASPKTGELLNLNSDYKYGYWAKADMRF